MNADEPVRAQPDEPGRDWLPWVVPLALFLVAAAIRLVVATQLPYPSTEPSAYYVNVAQNLVSGDGLVSDGVWSYATAPLVAPKPAFELWLPMSSLVSAAAMSVLGSSFWAAQVGGALLGALVAPLSWAVALEAARTQRLDRRRRHAVAIASGLLAALLAPFVLNSVVPDSYTPFLVFMVLSALLIPRVLGIRDGVDVGMRDPSSAVGFVLGITLGLAYLSRQEVIWLGLTVLIMAGWVARGRPPGDRAGDIAGRLVPVFVGGLVIVVPWLVRNVIDFGSPFPGQAIENAFLIKNEDIFAFLERPSVSSYLDQGLVTVLTNPLVAAWDGFVNVVAVPAFPIGLAGLAVLVGMRRAPALRRPTALVALLISGGLTFVTTVVLFPVATLWGTFLHASGPLLVGLIVAATLGGDTLLARISAAREWGKPNVILAPIALIAVALLLAFFQVRILSHQSSDAEQRYATVAASIEAAAAGTGAGMPDTIISDHPVFLADALGQPVVALPDEEPESLVALGRRFDTDWVVVVDRRGRYPERLLDASDGTCLSAEPLALTDGPEPAWLFILDRSCAAA